MTQPEVQVELNRNILAQLAIYEPFSFRALVDTVRTHGQVAEKTYPDYGLLHTSVAHQVQKVTRQPPVQLWSQQPSISDAYFLAQAKRLDAIAETQRQQQELEEQEAQAQEEGEQQQQGQ
jgi:hypothetical protein